MNKEQKQAVVALYFIIGLLVGIYDWQWGDYAYKGFAYNLGMGLVWPATLPIIGPVIKFILGGLILIVLLIFILS